MIDVSTHSRLKAAGCCFGLFDFIRIVSTHSRLKAAGSSSLWIGSNHSCFNTQPPEGGWFNRLFHWIHTRGFNTQPPEGGWIKFC